MSKTRPLGVFIPCTNIVKDIHTCHWGGCVPMHNHFKAISQSKPIKLYHNKILSRYTQTTYLFCGRMELYNYFFYYFTNGFYVLHRGCNLAYFKLTFFHITFKHAMLCPRPTK